MVACRLSAATDGLNDDDDANKKPIRVNNKNTQVISKSPSVSTNAACWFFFLLENHKFFIGNGSYTRQFVVYAGNACRPLKGT